MHVIIMYVMHVYEEGVMSLVCAKPKSKPSNRKLVEIRASCYKRRSLIAFHPNSLLSPFCSLTALTTNNNLKLMKTSKHGPTQKQLKVVPLKSNRKT